MFKPVTVKIETRWDDTPENTIVAFRQVSPWSELIFWTRLKMDGQFERRVYFPKGRQVLTKVG